MIKKFNNKELIQFLVSLSFRQANPALPENFNITEKLSTTVISAKLSF